MSASWRKTNLVAYLRGLFCVGVIWGLLWVVLAMIVGTIIGVIDPADIDPGEEPIVLAPIIGFVGFTCGVIFGALWSTTRRSAVRLVPAMALGMVVCAALPIVLGKDVWEWVVTVPLGAISAAASVMMARTWSALDA